MSYSKFNKAFLIAGLVAVGAIAGLQGCSSDDTQTTPSGGAGKSSGTAGKAGATGNKAGSSNNGEAGENSMPSGGTGNVGGDAGAPSEGGEGGEAGAPTTGDCTDPLTCNEGTCDLAYDNSTLGLKNGKLPALP